MKKALKVIGIILAVIILLLVAVYLLVLQFPNLNENPKEGKWYRITSDEMKASDGSDYHAFFKKGSENKVLVYFAGGGVSINEQMARNDTYNTKMVSPDLLANFTMNMGGLATAADGNLFKDWTVIAFPYATGDFHSGTGEFAYTDKDGKEKILYHNGYTNFTAAMQKVMEITDVESADTVVVTGYSAGGWGAAILAEDVFTEYFPNAESKTVLVDASVALCEDWIDSAKIVWKMPEHISERLITNNLTLDCLTALHNDLGDSVSILFDCSTRDGDLAKIQRYFDERVIDESNGEMPVDEKDGDLFQQMLSEFIPQLKEQTGAYCYIYDGQPWYDDPRNLTMHTLIATPTVHEDLNNNGCSIAQWLMNAVNGEYKDYGLDLLNKKYD